ncbi:hypothetical protein G6514_002774 [Epicoccum nigrum]|nr:hypothetical protein G6514_002774 [Epicoccum nigrum]
MLFTTVAALLFPVAVMTAPTRKPITKEGECTPVTLTLTEYVVAEAASYTYISFNAQSQYIANSPADDVLRSGVNCEVDGVTIPTGDIQCNIGGHRIEDLTFQLTDTSGGRGYKLDHTWQCDGETWTSSTDVFFDVLSCETSWDSTNGQVVECSAQPEIVKPQGIHNKKAASNKNITDDKTHHGNNTTHSVGAKVLPPPAHPKHDTL